MTRSWLGTVVRLGAVLILALLFSGCSLQPVVKIGLVAELTGKQSDLGIQLRNGIQMAVNEINDAGGIRGRRVDLVIVDEVEFAQDVDQSLQELIDQKVVAVLGPVTSDHTLTLYKATEAREMVLFSSTAATSALSGIQDHFFRTFVSTDFLASQMAEYIYLDRKLTQIAVIYDTDNLSYTETIYNSFTTKFRSLGGEVSAFQKYSSAESPDFESMIQAIKISEPEGVLIITSPTDAGLIAQAVRMAEWQPELFGAPWTQGPALIEMGGVAVEGMEAITPFDINEDSDPLKRFISDYQNEYAAQPLFAAVSGYETMMYLAQALQTTRGRSSGLEDAMLTLADFPGLSSPINLDAFGDAFRPLIIQKVVNGEFITIEQLDPGR